MIGLDMIRQEVRGERDAHTIVLATGAARAWAKNGRIRTFDVAKLLDVGRWRLEAHPLSPSLSLGASVSRS